MSSGPQHPLTSIQKGKCEPVNKKIHPKERIYKIPVKILQVLLCKTMENRSRSDPFLTIVAKIWASYNPKFFFWQDLFFSYDVSWEHQRKISANTEG